MAEVLAPTRKDIAGEFDRGFEGMTAEPVKLSDLLAARESIIAAIVGEMPGRHKEFLIGFNRGEPDWARLGLQGVADLPAVRWRQQNLDKLSAEARRSEVEKLERALFPRGVDQIV
jgi:hypothetical protein